ncbi:hypothetical protein [Streptomyces sp. NBC_00878]|uniref:hypothetical protein n=1 Tax=Streptomyces sp. NBC_00878 TaxID=2975854 RepID=UPI00224C9215|nr:hypothetical protein [Streptomyces sp. NBC_00878]MCX4909594.1 hypothetical protein [Streptomyces sp. NBC_00878]
MPDPQYPNIFEDESIEASRDGKCRNNAYSAKIQPARHMFLSEIMDERRIGRGTYRVWARGTVPAPECGAPGSWRPALLTK